MLISAKGESVPDSAYQDAVCVEVYDKDPRPGVVSCLADETQHGGCYYQVLRKNCILET